MNNNILCKNCKRFYSTGADQCDIPNIGITGLHAKRKLEESGETSEADKQEIKFNQAVYGNNLDNLSEEDIERADFFLKRTKSVHPNSKKTHVYGHPSELNYDNSCVFYDPILINRGKFGKIFKLFKLKK